ncbi:MAG: high frequency lysogenization protein HflD [Gammaproteobacteria bacterium]|nr:high frequency lysogenization protein HflD [Gammaproteobacteria bacterium]
MASSWTDRTFALAGIFQSATLVYQLATTGKADEAAALTSIESLFKIDADNVPSVFSGTEGVSVGLRALAVFAGSDKSEANLTILAYVFSLMHLTHKMLRRPELHGQLTRLIQSVQRQKDYFESMQQNEGINATLLARFADIYSKTMSTLQPRIIVKGSPDFLQQDDIVIRIRCLLLAGARAAVLWEQLGGGRVQFLFKRKQFAAMAKELMNE